MNKPVNPLLILLLVTIGSTGSANAGEPTRRCATMEVTARTSLQPLLTLTDFTAANVSLTEGAFVLNIDLTSDASKRWVEFTAKNVGQMITFSVDGKLIKTAKIVDPNLGKGLLLGSFEKSEAQSLADIINDPATRCSRQK